MTWLALLTLAAEPLAAPSCARVDARYLVRIESSSELATYVVVHPSGGVIWGFWGNAQDYAVRAWSEPAQKPVIVQLPGTGLYQALEDGRLVLLDPTESPDGGREMHYGVWSWDGNTRLRWIGDAKTAYSLAALLCQVPESALGKLSAPTRVVCVDGRLIANDKESNVLVWQRKRWERTGVQLELPDWQAGMSRLLLRAADFDRTSAGLERYAIPTLKEPDWKAGSPLREHLLKNDTCGRHACWAVDGSGRVLVYDFRISARAWAVIGEIDKPNTFVHLSGDERAVLLLRDCPHSTFYLALPPLKASTPTPKK